MTGRQVAGRIALGMLAGITWGCALRLLMADVAGSASTYSWWGTFGAIVLPAAVTGALLGWAWARRDASRSTGWLRLAPLAYLVIPQLAPDALITLLTTGLGAGGPSIGLLGVANGYALGRVGPAWTRIVAGVLALAGGIAFGLAASVLGGPDLVLTEPRGIAAAVLAAGLYVLYAISCAVPFTPNVEHGAHQARRELPRSPSSIR